MASLAVSPSSTSKVKVATRQVVLAGNPNSGKTTLFNALTGLRAKVGNYPGVTVETKKGPCSCQGKNFDVIDFRAVRATNATCFERLAHLDREASERGGVVSGHGKTARFDQEEPVAAPGHVSGDFAVSRNVELHPGAEAIALHIAHGDAGAIV